MCNCLYVIVCLHVTAFMCCLALCVCLGDLLILSECMRHWLEWEHHIWKLGCWQILIVLKIVCLTAEWVNMGVKVLFGREK